MKLPELSLAEAASRNRLLLIDQLYLTWHGYYVVLELVGGKYVRHENLSYDEAIVWRNPDTTRFSLGVEIKT